MKVLRIFDRINDILAVVGASTLVVMMLLTLAMVLFRYFLHSPIVWAIEMCEWLVLWTCFLGTAWLLKREGHIKVEILTDRLSPRNQALLGIITSVIGVILSSLFAWYGALVAWDFFQMGAYEADVVNFPLFPAVGTVAVGYSLLFIQFLRRSYGYLRRLRAA